MPTLPYLPSFFFQSLQTNGNGIFFKFAKFMKEMQAHFFNFPISGYYSRRTCITDTNEPRDAKLVVTAGIPPPPSL